MIMNSRDTVTCNKPSKKRNYGILWDFIDWEWKAVSLGMDSITENIYRIRNRGVITAQKIYTGISPKKLKLR